MSIKKKKILHITHNMSIGGAEQVIKQLINGLDTERFDNSVVCIDGVVGAMSLELKAKGIIFYAFKRGSGLDWALVKKIRNLVKVNKIDIVHCHQYTPYTYGTIATAFLKTRVLFTEHGRFFPDRYTWKRRLINQLLALATDSIVAISESTKNALTKYEWLPDRAISVIYNGLVPVPTSPVTRINTRNKLEYGDDDIVLGTISRLDPIKNQLMMIEALSRLIGTNASIKLLVVGDGPELENLQKKVSSLDLTEYVKFVGYQNDPHPYLQAIDIFLLTSFSEGTSMTLLEAMAAGKPCIATNVGGNSEVIDNGVDGILIESDDIDGLTDAVKSLLSVSGFQQKISKNSVEKFRSKFELSFMIEEYQNIYDRLR